MASGAGSEVISIIDADPNLGELPAVTIAMGELTRAGLISRGEDRLWVVHGDPPEELRNNRPVPAAEG